VPNTVLAGRVADRADDATIRYSAVRFPAGSNSPRVYSDTTIDSNVRPVDYNTGHPAGLFRQTNRKDSPVKTRIALFAVVFGSMLLALVLADGPWPPIHM
jgi:hypothetical protein